MTVHRAAPPGCEKYWSSKSSGFLCRINGGHFEEDKGPVPGHESRDLEEEEVEEPGAEEEGGEQSKVVGKPADDALPSNLVDDDDDVPMREEMDFEGPNDLELNCKPSPRR